MRSEGLVVTRTPVVLVHGAWFHRSSWEDWAERFTSRGFAVHVPGWPGEAVSAAEERRNPGPYRNVGLAALIEHYEVFVRSLDSRPVLIGHSLGGLLVQHLLGVGLGRAAVAIAPWRIPDGLADSESFGQSPWSYFRNSIANTIGEDEAEQLFERHVVHPPRRLLAGLGSDRIIVDTADTTRGPLLLISGQEDRVVPDAVTRAAYKAYGDTVAVTDLKQFADRGHSLVIDNGWRTVADYVLAWLAANGIGPDIAEG
jgi:alpha-beta hydrolase superfamily lysophospholipase